MDIFNLVSITTKQELKKYLKDNSLEYNRSFGQVDFKATFFDTSFTVFVDIFQRKIRSFRVVMDKEKYTYDQMTDHILKIKEELIAILGQPKLDNTNHLDSHNISVHFENETISVSLLCQDIHDYGSYPCAAIVLHNISIDSEQVMAFRDKSKFILWILSLFGGFLWGLAMFAGMGAEWGYTPETFGIWMLGGLVFGVLFAIFFGIWSGVGNRKLKPNKPRTKMIEKAFFLENEDNIYTGNCVYWKDRTPRAPKQYSIPALLKIADHEVIMYSLLKKEPLLLKNPLKESYYQLLGDSLCFKSENGRYTFGFTDRDSVQRAENEFYTKCIKPEAYSSLFSELKKATVDYNPYSIYNSYSLEILDSKIEVITKGLLVRDEITKQELKSMIFITFDYDAYYAEVLTGLYLDTFLTWNKK